MDFRKCYVCDKKKKLKDDGVIMGNLGMCSNCYKSFTRTDGAGSNRVAAMVWACKRVRKLERLKASKVRPFYWG